MSLLIRPLAETDHADWLAQWHRYLAYHGTRADDAPATTWDRLLDPAEPVNGICAVHEDRFVGFAHFVFHRHTWWPSDVCLLIDVFASEVARGLGVGAALLEDVYARAHAAGSRCVWGITFTDNVPARKIYDRLAVQLDQVVYSKILQD